MTSPIPALVPSHGDFPSSVYDLESALQTQKSEAEIRGFAEKCFFDDPDRRGEQDAKWDSSGFYAFTMAYCLILLFRYPARTQKNWEYRKKTILSLFDKPNPRFYAIAHWEYLIRSNVDQPFYARQQLTKSIDARFIYFKALRKQAEKYAKRVDLKPEWAILPNGCSQEVAWFIVQLDAYCRKELGKPFTGPVYLPPTSRKDPYGDDGEQMQKYLKDLIGLQIVVLDTDEEGSRLIHDGEVKAVMTGANLVTSTDDGKKIRAINSKFTRSFLEDALKSPFEVDTLLIASDNKFASYDTVNDLIERWERALEGSDREIITNDLIKTVITGRDVSTPEQAVLEYFTEKFDMRVWRYVCSLDSELVRAFEYDKESEMDIWKKHLFSWSEPDGSSVKPSERARVAMLSDGLLVQLKQVEKPLGENQLSDLVKGARESLSQESSRTKKLDRDPVLLIDAPFDLVAKTIRHNFARKLGLPIEDVGFNEIEFAIYESELVNRDGELEEPYASALEYITNYELELINHERGVFLKSTAKDDLAVSAK